MIVVDTSVWIDFFNGRDARHVDVLARLIEVDAGIALTDIILTEVLQGIRSDQRFWLVDELLASFDVLRLERLDDFRRAAELYRESRRRGITVRRTLDCLIASVCVRESVPILHNDRDFDRLARCSALQIHECRRQAFGALRPVDGTTVGRGCHGRRRDNRPAISVSVSTMWAARDASGQPA